MSRADKLLQLQRAKEQSELAEQRLSVVREKIDFHRSQVEHWSAIGWMRDSMARLAERRGHQKIAQEWYRLAEEANELCELETEREYEMDGALDRSEIIQKVMNDDVTEFQRDAKAEPPVHFPVLLKE